MNKFSSQTVFKIVTAFWLGGWYIKSSFFVPYLSDVAFVVPVQHTLFPVLFQNPIVSWVFYVLPLLCLSVFFVKNEKCFRLAALLMLISSVVMFCHINTYNDATFVTSFWCAFWLLWLSEHLDNEDVSFHGPFLAQCLIGVIFLGGFVGKLTPEYYRGDIIHHIFIEQGGGSPLKWMLSGMHDQRGVVALISIVILASEGILATLPLWSFRWAAMIVFVTLPVITLFSTWRILSVLLCLLGLMVGGWCWKREPAQGT